MWQEKFVEYAGKKMCYSIKIEEGREKECKNLIFIHGLMEAKWIWEDFVQEIIALQKTHSSLTYKYIAIDLPGQGKSQNLPQHSLEAWADVVLAIAEAEGLKSFSLIGHSMGGYVCLQSFLNARAGRRTAAAAYVASAAASATHAGDSQPARPAAPAACPAKIDSIILLNSHAASDSEAAKQNRSRTIALLEKGGEEKKNFVSRFMPNLFMQENRQKFASQIERLETTAQNMSLEAIIGIEKALLERPSYVDNLPDISQNTKIIFIYGKQDDKISEAELFSQFSKCQTASLVCLNSAHMAFWEDKQRAAKAVFAGGM